MEQLVVRGLSENQAGGLSRQKTLIDRLKIESANESTLLINAGNNFDITSHDIHIAPSYIARALELKGTEVIAPGVQEITYGSENG